MESEVIGGKHFIYLYADEAIVTSTPMAGWFARERSSNFNGRDQKGLPHSVTVRCFTTRCDISEADADRNFFNGLSAFTFRITDDCFSRIFAEFKRAGLPELLAEAQAEDMNDLDKVIKEINIDEDQLLLSINDFETVEAFDVPGVAAVAARNGNAARRAIAAIKGPDTLRFIHMAGISRLVQPKEDSYAPFEIIAKLIGSLGHCLSHVTRADMSLTDCFNDWICAAIFYAIKV